MSRCASPGTWEQEPCARIPSRADDAIPDAKMPPTRHRRSPTRSPGMAHASKRLQSLTKPQRNNFPTCTCRAAKWHEDLAPYAPLPGAQRRGTRAMYNPAEPSPRPRRRGHDSGCISAGPQGGANAMREEAKPVRTVHGFRSSAAADVNVRPHRARSARPVRLSEGLAGPSHRHCCGRTRLLLSLSLSLTLLCIA